MKIRAVGFAASFSLAFASIATPVTTLAPPNIQKSFGAATIALGDSTTLTFQITNPNTAGSAGQLTGIGFTDTLPGGLVVATPSVVTGTCDGGTITANPGASTVNLSGAQRNGGLQCTFSVNVTGTAAGVQNNSVTVSSTNGGTNPTPATASVTVLAPPNIQKSFGAATIPLGASTTLSFTITNPNATRLDGIGFTDTLPTGLVVATPSVVTGTCDGGTITANPGANIVSLSGAQRNGGASCTFSVNVTGTATGPQNNSVTVSSSNGGANPTPATASVTVLAPPTIQKSFGAATIPLGASTTLSFTIANPNAGNTLSDIAFTDSLPAGLVVATPPGVIGTCGGGTITATAGSTSVSLASATLSGNANCTFSVNVTGTAAGPQNNSVTVSSSNGGSNPTPATASVTVVAPPAISKKFNPSSIPLNGTSTLTFTITNPAANAVALTGVTFIDTLPTGLTVASNTTPGVCGGTLTTTAPTGIALSGATINSNSQCQFSVTVTGAAAGDYTNTTANVGSTNGGGGSNASDKLTVVAPPSILKTFGTSKIQPGGTTTMNFTITNSNPTATLTAVGFNDSLPAGLVIASTPNLTNSCGGTITPASLPLATNLNLSGATLPPGSCIVTVQVQGTTEGLKSNSATVTSTNGGTGNTSTAVLSVATPPNLSKSFGAVSIGVKSTVSLTFTLSNPNQVTTLTGIAFTDTLPAGLVVANSSAAACGGTLTTTAPATIALSGGILAAGGQCQFTVNVTADGTALNLLTNTTGPVSSNQAPTTANGAVANLFIGDPYQISYAANLAAGDSYVNITNTGASGGVTLQSGTTATVGGSICANVYVFTPDEEIVSCCSCPVTPNGLVSLSAQKDLIVNPLTRGTPTSVVIKLVATAPLQTAGGASCNNSAGGVGTAALANGLAAWDTTLHSNSSPAPAKFELTETPFKGATLSASELARLQQTCSFILAQGSGFGICNSCRLGGLGGAKQ